MRFLIVKRVMSRRSKPTGFEDEGTFFVKTTVKKSRIGRGFEEDFKEVSDIVVRETPEGSPKTTEVPSVSTPSRRDKGGGTPK